MHPHNLTRIDPHSTPNVAYGREEKKDGPRTRLSYRPAWGIKFYLILMTVTKKIEDFLACYLLIHDYRYLKSNDEDELGHIA
jgi:hypothetical protein